MTTRSTVPHETTDMATPHETSVALEAVAYEVLDGRQRHTLLSEIDLELREGAVTVLVGPNGAGKSTLLRVIAGLLDPTAGTRSLRARGVPAQPLPDDLRERGRWVHFVAAEHHPVFDFRVEQVVAMGRYPHRGRSGQLAPHDLERVRIAMARTDVSHLAERSVLSLSSGEQRRVWIARALVTEARFILLDEPTANLDPGHALDVYDLIRSLARTGHGLVVAVHDLQAAYSLADEVVLLHRGRIHAQGAPEKVLQDTALADVFGVRFQQINEPASPLDAVRALRTGPRTAATEPDRDVVRNEAD